MLEEEEEEAEIIEDTLEMSAVEKEASGSFPCSINILIATGNTSFNKYGYKND